MTDDDLILRLARIKMRAERRAPMDVIDTMLKQLLVDLGAGASFDKPVFTPATPRTEKVPF